MKQTDKKLLFVDLCARVPYYPYALFDSNKKFDGGLRAPIIGMVNKGNTGVIKYNQMFYAYGCMTPFSIEEFRIYLRPISSMTIEEKLEYAAFIYSDSTTVKDIVKLIDWFNAHYFDFRNLIERGLALEAPEGMYNLNK